MLLPITKVIIYKHGLAFFHHEGEVEDNQTVEFFFKSKDMNDVLKSFTIMDAQEKTKVDTGLTDNNNNNSGTRMRTHTRTRACSPVLWVYRLLLIFPVFL